MSEISFMRDRDRSRLVIPVGEMNGYSLRMMEKRSFEGLMPVEILSLNGDSYCCYDVSGAVSLENRCRAFRPGGEELDRLFESFASLCSELEDYLMDSSGILLDPCYVFYDPGRECYRFVLDPSGGSGGAGSLLTFLTDMVDPSDDDAVSFIYGLCEMSMTDDHFSLLPALENLNKKRGNEAGFDFSDAVPVNDSDSLFGMGFDIPDYAEEPEAKADHGSDSRISMIYILSAVIGILGLAGAAVLYLTFEMAVEELCVTAACAAVMFGVTLYSLRMISAERKRTSGSEKKRSSPDEKGTADVPGEKNGTAPPEKAAAVPESRNRAASPEERAACSAEKEAAVSRDRGETAPGKTETRDQTEKTGALPEEKTGPVSSERTGPDPADRKRVLFRMKRKEKAPDVPGFDGEEEVNPSAKEPFSQAGAEETALPADDMFRAYALEERTVIFTDNKQPEEYALYSLDGCMPSISLSKLPAIAGKIKGLSDIVLPDASVSRLHARFDKEAGRVTVTDLDSTNGTFINGKRLMPNETCALRSGDELRLGTLSYCMR